jgi:hypothetical protein
VSQYPEALHRTIVVVDVARFTDPIRTVLHQEAIHEGIYGVLRKAFQECDIDWSACTAEDRGDGALILVPPDVPKIRLADRLPGRLLAGLRRYNRVHSTEATIQLRVALHAGEVRGHRNGQVSQEINFACRILDADTAKTALARTNGVLAVIASDVFYQHVVVPDPAAEPQDFQQIAVKVKQTEDVAWLRLLGTEARVLGLLPESDLSSLRDALTGVAVPQLPTLVRRATGPGAPLAPAGADAWETLQYLTDFNSGPDGFPPAMAFLELLARQIGGASATLLTRWNDAQARRLRLESALDAWRAANPAPVAESRLHLMIVIQHDGIDPSRYLVSHWRQDDPDQWPPPAGGTRLVALDRLERQVDNLVLAAETAWTGHRGTVALEFVLPRSLLGMPVHDWHKEHDSGDPRPLCLDYPIVVRSLERMMAPHWHRAWSQRWRMLMADPASARVHFADPTDSSKPHRLDVLLEEDHLVASVVLAAAPPITPCRGDQLTTALRSGLPAVFWLAGEAAQDDLRTLITQLVEGGGLGDLPMRTKFMRHDAFLSSPGRFDSNMVRNLVVLWDDPCRLVAFDQPGNVIAGQGGGGSEGERAS